MIDLHCHILPGIDDGASSIADSIALLRLAAADGITHMVATPHINPGYFDNNRNTINQALVQVRSAITQEQIAISVAAAAEVRLTADLMPAIEQQQLPFIGEWQGQKLLLLELPPSHVPPGSDKLVKWLAQRNITVMIAHPERNREVQADLAILDSFVRLGCLFQLTASSLLGDLGERHQQTALHLVKKRLYHVMASDCHNVQRRPPKLTASLTEVAKVSSQDYAESLVLNNPRLITASLDFQNGQA
jgi:protein-tyrosine phosphatase